MASSTRYCGRCKHFKIDPPQRLLGRSDSPWCVIHGESVDPPRMPTEADALKDNRPPFKAFEYRPEDFDYDLSEELDDDDL